MLAERIPGLRCSITINYVTPLEKPRRLGQLVYRVRRLALQMTNLGSILCTTYDLPSSVKSDPGVQSQGVNLEYSQMWPCLTNKQANKQRVGK